MWGGDEDYRLPPGPSFDLAHLDVQSDLDQFPPCFSATTDMASALTNAACDAPRKAVRAPPAFSGAIPVQSQSALFRLGDPLPLVPPLECDTKCYGG